MKYLSLVVWIAVSFLPALSGIWAKPDAWYAQLAKPAWNPPNWVFAPVWTLLYALMGVAAWFIWRAPVSALRRAALALFVIQLVLNALWTPLFFGAHRLDLALAEILLLWAGILGTIVLAWRVRPLAGALLAPYLLWVTFAAALNAALWHRNPQ